MAAEKDVSEAGWQQTRTSRTIARSTETTGPTTPITATSTPSPSTRISEGENNISKNMRVKATEGRFDRETIGSEKQVPARNNSAPQEEMPAKREASENERPLSAQKKSAARSEHQQEARGRQETINSRQQLTRVDNQLASKINNSNQPTGVKNQQLKSVEKYLQQMMAVYFT